VKKIVAAFDFDVTITTKDTFFPFLVHTFGLVKVLSALVKLAPEGIFVLMKLSSRDGFKEKIIECLFKGESVQDINEFGLSHSTLIMNWIRPSALKRIRWHKSKGHYLVLVSASLDVYLTHIANNLEFDKLLCTTLAVNENEFSGKLVGSNCRGPVKVTRLESHLGHLPDYEIYAYGDSAGDYELLKAADHPHWRLFENEILFNSEE